MGVNGEPGDRGELLALVMAEALFVVRAVEDGESERCAFGQVRLLRRLFGDPGERLEAYARLLGLEASGCSRTASGSCGRRLSRRKRPTAAATTSARPARAERHTA